MDRQKLTSRFGWLGRWPDLLALLIVSVWTLIYGAKTLTAHWSLQTNAYDLSVFDYALWNTLEGRFGHVPFFGFSIFSQHFMPILFLLAPIYAAARRPELLILLQVTATAGAGWLFYLTSQRLGLRPWFALWLTVVFLFSRRTHGAVVSVFYPESFQPALAIGMVLAWVTSRRKTFWCVTVLLLMTKEDAPVYVGAFGLVQLWLSPRRRRESLATVALACLWLVMAVGVAIPSSRAADHLAASNPLFEARFGASDAGLDIGTLTGRVLSFRSVAKIGELLLTVGVLPLAGAEWLAVALPGIAINLAAAPESMQPGLVAHYAWAILPWIFLAGAVGVVRVHGRFPVAAKVWIGVLVVGTLVDTPFTQRFSLRSYSASSRETTRQLQDVGITRSTVVLTQTNLLPHVPHVDSIYTLGGLTMTGPPDLVLLVREGDPWPLNLADLEKTIGQYRADARYEQISSGPLIAFRRR